MGGTIPVNQGVLGWFDRIRTPCLLAVGLLAVTALSNTAALRLIPSLGHGWTVMHRQSAACALLASTGIILRERERAGSSLWFVLGSICGVAAIIIACAAFTGHLLGLGAAAVMSAPAAGCYGTVGLSLLIDKRARDWLGYAADGLVSVLVILDIILISGNVFGATHLQHAATVDHVSVLTLICVSLLAFVQVGRRVPYGFFSVLASSGIGGRFSRHVLPLASVAFYLIILSGKYLYGHGYLPLPYAAAATASALEALLFVVVISLAHKIDVLERNVHDMAVTDELTGIYNRRGFYLFADQLLNRLQRERIPATAIYLDVDGLKRINDQLGHDVGSALIGDVAALLRGHFRSSDVVGRVGGDEFAVLARGDASDVAAALERLYAAADAMNGTGDRPYTVSFSAGSVTTEAKSAARLDDLITGADEAMYGNKQKRRLSAEAGTAHPSPSAESIA